MKRKITAFALILAAALFTISGIPDIVSYAVSDYDYSLSEGVTNSGLQYSMLDDGTYEISGYSGSGKTVNIPAEINGRNVIIGNYAFKSKNIKSVTIPDTITSIGECAFIFCEKLETVKLSSSLTEIGYDAFSGCVSLKSIDIPNSVTSIGKSAFSGCIKLESIKISDNVTKIEGYTFINCFALKEVKLPKKLKSIGDSAFFRCPSLESLTIPNSTESIGYEVFADCYKLETIKLPKSLKELSRNTFSDCAVKNITISKENKYFTVSNGILYDKDKTLLILCPRDKTQVKIPSTVKTVGDWAFANCTELEKVVFPDSLEKIGDNSFRDCKSLNGIKLPDSLKQVGSYAFYNCNKIRSVTIPESVETIYRMAFGYRYNSKMKTEELVPNFKIKCHRKSKGEEYAVNHDIEYTLI